MQRSQPVNRWGAAIKSRIFFIHHRRVSFLVMSYMPTTTLLLQDIILCVSQDGNKLRRKKRFRIAFYANIFAKSALLLMAEDMLS